MLTNKQLHLMSDLSGRSSVTIDEDIALHAALAEIAALRQFREAALSALGEHPDTEQIDIAQRISDIRDEGRAHFHALTKMGEQITSLTDERDRLLAASNEDQHAIDWLRVDLDDLRRLWVDRDASEVEAGKRCGVDRDAFGVDWPEHVAAKLVSVTAERDRLAAAAAFTVHLRYICEYSVRHYSPGGQKLSSEPWLSMSAAKRILRDMGDFAEAAKAKGAKP